MRPTPYDPHSPYSASKASSDMLVKAYMDTYKFPANITNWPYQFPEKLIPLIINNAACNFRFTVMEKMYVTGCMWKITARVLIGLSKTYNIGGTGKAEYPDYPYYSGYASGDARR